MLIWALATAGVCALLGCSAWVAAAVGFQPLSPHHWVVILLICLVSTSWIEFVKLLYWAFGRQGSQGTLDKDGLDAPLIDTPISV
jgi:hypothetical protein